MDNESAIEMLEKRADKSDTKMEALTSACQNLALTAGKHDEQIAILTKVVYGGAAIFVAQVVTLLVKAGK